MNVLLKQVLIGGPFPCQDHAQRGMELAFSILHLMHCISDRFLFGIRGVVKGVGVFLSTSVGFVSRRVIRFGLI